MYRFFIMLNQIITLKFSLIVHLFISIYFLIIKLIFIFTYGILDSAYQSFVYLFHPLNFSFTSNIVYSFILTRYFNLLNAVNILQIFI
jgi:hypothetical protein